MNLALRGSEERKKRASHSVKNRTADALFRSRIFRSTRDAFSKLSHCFSNDFFVWPEFNVERFFNHSEKLPGIFS
jgi:hypothetical protein